LVFSYSVASPKAISTAIAFEADERQQRAIQHVNGPLLVVAGAGTGKTTVLTRRIAHLVREGHARPNEIIAVTYTENAAREMRERVESDLGRNDARICTFHAFCNNLLISRGKQFGVLDDKDLWIYLRRRIRDLRLNYFIRAGNLAKFLEDLLDFMRRCQDELVGPEKYSGYVDRLELGELPVPRVCKSKHTDELTKEEVLGRCREIANVYSTVERMLREENLGTFGHMITRAHDLLQDPEIVASERKRTRFILVDEFQDANFAQVKILQKLASEEQNVFAVGDPDQAIYRFRGASSAAFGLFRRNFPQAGVIVLDKNRRSTTPILKCAFALISNNPISGHGAYSVLPARSIAAPTLAYKRSPLVSARDEDALAAGGRQQSVPVELVVLNAKETECSDVVAAIRKQRHDSRCRWKDIAVLYRLHSHRDQVAAELQEHGVPFSIENMDVMDSPEARDLFACLGAVASEADSASLFRVAALPQFSIDPEKLRAGIRALPRESQSAGVALVLRQIEGGGPVLETVGKVRDEIAVSGATSLDALETIIRRFSIDRDSPAVKAILEFVKAWGKKPLTKTKEIAELLEYLEYFREADGAICLPPQEENAVRLLTAHTAKGLEFQHVFILRASSPSFPKTYNERMVEFPRELRDPDSAAEADDKALHEEEERRLFYVAMTRARDTLTIYARKGTGKTDPSPPGFMRPLIKDASLKPYLRVCSGRGFQTDMFAEAQAPMIGSRTSEWLSLPPAFNLHERLSASAVQTYQTCPLQFKLEREWRIPHEVPAAMQYGAAIHRVLKTFFDSVHYQRTLAEDDLVELLTSDLAQAGIEDRYQHELYVRQGVDQLHAFLDAFRKGRAPDVLHTEEQFEIRIGVGVVVGRIDRIDRAADRTPDNRVVIIDYKTGKPKSQEDADESLQLSIYALAAREKWGYQADRLSFYNLEENSSVISRRSELQLQEARLKVEQVAEDIAAGKFQATPGFHCRFCSYRNLCPETEIRTFQAAKKLAKSN
jgi:DNA helicase-2/ATP-dependent DNA helicase PcrA